VQTKPLSSDGLPKSEAVFTNSEEDVGWLYSRMATDPSYRPIAKGMVLLSLSSVDARQEAQDTFCSNSCTFEFVMLVGEATRAS
jgi:hypothetical protein